MNRSWISAPHRNALAFVALTYMQMACSFDGCRSKSSEKSDPEYSAEWQDAAVNEVVGTWQSADGHVRIQLCEDTSAATADVPYSPDISYLVSSDHNGMRRGVARYRHESGGFGCTSSTNVYHHVGIPVRATVWLDGAVVAENRRGVVDLGEDRRETAELAPSASPHALKLENTSIDARWSATGELLLYNVNTWAFRRSEALLSDGGVEEEDAGGIDADIVNEDASVIDAHDADVVNEDASVIDAHDADVVNEDASVIDAHDADVVNEDASGNTPRADAALTNLYSMYRLSRTSSTYCSRP